MNWHKIRGRLSRMSVFICTTVVGLIVIGFPFIHAVAQSTAARNSPTEQILVSLLESDEKRGEWIFYRQRFRDTENKWAQYTGSIYAGVKEVTIKGCRINFETVLADHFTGLVGETATGEQQDNSSYSFSFTLTPSIADALEIFEAPPIQLRRTTHPICDEKPSCALTWLRIKTKDQEITQAVVTNNLLEFRGTTALALLPVSSPQVGGKIIQQFRTLSDSHCR
jgi:hypothetical protein